MQFGTYLRLEKGLKVPLRTIYRVLNEIPTYVYHKKAKKLKPSETRHYQISGSLLYFEADLCFMPEDKSTGCKAIFCCKDVFSNFLWTKSIERKTKEEMIECFNYVFSSIDDQLPNEICTDMGNEFLSLRNYFQEKGIYFYPNKTELRSITNPRAKTYMWACKLHQVLITMKASTK